MSRICGECTMCCKLMEVKKLDKPAGRWCSHCNIGSGCRIYDSRPEGCRDFECMWLQSAPEQMSDALRPDRCKVVLTPSTDGERIVAFVDPNNPQAYNQGEIGRFIDRILEHYQIVVVTGERRTLITCAAKPELVKIQK